jgi:hypothetical protein
MFRFDVDIEPRVTRVERAVLVGFGLVILAAVALLALL